MQHFISTSSHRIHQFLLMEKHRAVFFHRTQTQGTYMYTCTCRCEKLASHKPIGPSSQGWVSRCFYSIQLLTLGAHAQRGLRQFGLCVCLSVNQHLTSRAYFCPENHITYSTGNEGQKICGVFPENARLQRSSISLRCTASIQCKGTHSLGIGFFGATWNTSQCETATYLSLAAALVSVSCLAIFRIRSVTRNSLRLLPGYIPYTSVTRAFYQRVRFLKDTFHQRVL